MTDKHIIDIILHELFDSIEDYGTPVKTNILDTRGINLDKSQYERVIHTLLSDGLTERVKEDTISGDDDLTISRLGINIIKNYGSYSFWLQRNMTHTTEDTEIMDKVFNYLIAFHIDKTHKEQPDFTFLSQLFKIDEDLVQHALNEVCRTGHALGILRAKQLGYGNYIVVGMSDSKEKALKFKEQGGFKKYFAGDNFKPHTHNAKPQPAKTKLTLALVGLVLTLLIVWFRYQQLQ